ncbi:hypothetical protein KIL84_004513 [Mauremys mutica]|uniref:Uncharacterized protein n=1 Tax=Mauremys mutica TaxID=74926 RepID=A0A9D3XLL1_9SAUR|nr:hypothetical protein KIL84_004346 [Mauremys mutica]KAH1183021.1 hypothetical protein KIL84_004513 [Mauremys mutica]
MGCVQVCSPEQTKKHTSWLFFWYWEETGHWGTHVPSAPSLPANERCLQTENTKRMFISRIGTRALEPTATPRYKRSSTVKFNPALCRCGAGSENGIIGIFTSKRPPGRRGLAGSGNGT